MIIVFKQNATVAEKSKVKEQLESKGFQIHASDGVNASLFGVVGDTSTLATKLGVTEDALKSALEKARESLKSDSSSTERAKPSEQSEEQRTAEREERRTQLIAAVAKELNLDEAKVTAAVDEARAARTAEREASQKEKLDAAVTDGKLTQAEADAVQKALDAGIVELRGRGR